MRHPHQRGASITQVTNPTAVRAGPCGTARARDHPFRHLDRICDYATANHGRDGSTREAYFHRPNLASRHVRSNLVVCYRYASPPSPGTAELSRRACAAEVVRAGRVYIRCSAGAVTWLARPTGISAAHRPCTASVAAREGQRGNRQHRYDRCGNCCSSEDRTHSCRLPSSRASISSKHQSLRLRSVRRRPHSSRPRGDIASLRLPGVKDCSNPGDLQWGQLSATRPAPPGTTHGARPRAKKDPRWVDRSWDLRASVAPMAMRPSFQRQFRGTAAGKPRTTGPQAQRTGSHCRALCGAGQILIPTRREPG
jgi:hypothetical protein